MFVLQNLIRTCALLVFASLATAGASAQDLGSIEQTVQQALDQPMTQPVNIQSKPVRQALRALEEATGLRIVLTPAAMQALPFGEKTELAIQIENGTAREGLRRVFDGLGMEMTVEQGTGDIVVNPVPAVERLGRRMTLEEVTLLQMLSSQPWQAVVANLPVEFEASAAAEDVRTTFEQSVRSASGANGLEQLEQGAISAKLLWMPKGKGIVVYSATKDLERRMDRRISLNFRQQPIDRVLVDTGMVAGIDVELTPDAFAALAANPRLVDFSQRSTTLRETLNRICTNAKLIWKFEGNHIVVRASQPITVENPEPAPNSTGGGGRVVAIVRVPVGTDGTTVEFLIRDDELPPELRELKNRKMPEVLEQIRLKLAD